MKHVDCGACHACCHNQLVVLVPGEDPAAFDCYSIETASGLSHALKLKPDGSCTYLGENGCTIWPYHPRMCQEFDCADFARHYPRKRRRSLRMPMNDVLREGLQRGRLS